MFSSSHLKEKMEHIIVQKQKTLKHIKDKHGEVVIGDITVDQMIGGMRGMPGILYDTSKLHPLNGITYRGKDLYQVREQSPKAPGGS